MGVGLVRLRHLLHVVALLHRGAEAVGGVHQLVGEAVGHRLLAAGTAVVDDPADGERGRPARAHLDRNLVRGATDATAAHLERRLDVVDRTLDGVERIVTGLLGDGLHRVVHDLLCDAALAVQHDLVDQLGDEHRPVDRVGDELAAGGWTLTRHGSLVLLGAVPATGLLAVLHAGRVERAADDLVPDAGQVADATAADEHDRVLLEVVALAGDVGRHLDAAGETDAGHLAERRVRLLGRGRVHAGAHATALGRALQRGGLGLAEFRAATLADELLDGGHEANLFMRICVCDSARRETFPLRRTLQCYGRSSGRTTLRAPAR